MANFGTSTYNNAFILFYGDYYPCCYTIPKTQSSSTVASSSSGFTYVTNSLFFGYLGSSEYNSVSNGHFTTAINYLNLLSFSAKVIGSVTTANIIDHSICSSASISLSIT